MDIDTKLDILTVFVNYRTYLLNIEKEVARAKVVKDQLDAFTYVTVLMETPVSKLSKFTDAIWDFNKDFPGAAKNIQGAKLRIDFSKHTEIPLFIITELKVVFNLVFLNPLIFKGLYKKSKSKSKIKANTIIQQFEYGLAFINEIFRQVNAELGSEFVQDRIQTFPDILPEYYHKAAQNYKRVKGPDLDRFFHFIHQHASEKYVFGKKVPYVELGNLKWKKLADQNKGNKKNQVLPDIVFELLSKNSTFIVIDFLKAINEEVQDKGSINRLEVSEKNWAAEVGLNSKTLAAYVAYRLIMKGYSKSYIENQVVLPEWMLNKHSQLLSISKILELMKDKGYEINNLRQYINLVSYCCNYLVGQYTAMRPSELAGIVVKDSACLVEEEVWLIKSGNKKTKAVENARLFDDKWVAIPIVRDSIKAASHIVKLKASDYLFSNVDTVQCGQNSESMSSKGIQYQMNHLIERFFGKDIKNKIAFNPYMMRHTLTYQLFKAEVGLPLISFQLKHFVNSVSKFTSTGATSQVTLGYGNIGEMLSNGGNRKNGQKSLRHLAELDAVKAVNNPNGVFYGGKAIEHKKRLKKLFDGYMAAGYSEDEIYEAMVTQGIAIVHMGLGMCYGGREEDFDVSLPCIGSLRCNPARCKHAVVTKEHASKWREVYILNKANLNKPEYEYNRTYIEAAMNEAEMVLNNLGESVQL
jgi:integrase